MAHQFVREPLRAEEADRLANACRSPEEKLIVWTLLDTGLRVSELCSLSLDNVQWQQRSLRVTGSKDTHYWVPRTRITKPPRSQSLRRFAAHCMLGLSLCRRTACLSALSFCPSLAT
jgi:integrase/recombinase XerD